MTTHDTADEAEKPTAVRFGAVSKAFGDGDTRVWAVRGLSFSMPSGRFWALMGPSGSGKSTVLHLAAGLTPPTSGTVSIDDRNISTMSDSESAALRRDRVGYVLQSFNLLPFLTAQENVEMPLILQGCGRDEVQHRARTALKRVDMLQRALHKPTQLSGGEQQRIAIARALVIGPTIILADEPTGNLDRGSGNSIMELLRQVNEDLKVTILLVTHDPILASCAHRVLRLIDGRLDQEINLEDSETEAEDHRPSRNGSILCGD